MQEFKPADHNFASGFKTFCLLNIYIRNYTGLIILHMCTLLARLCCGFPTVRVWANLHSHIVVLCLDCNEHLDGRTMAAPKADWIKLVSSY